MKLISWLLLAATATAAEPVKLPLDVGTLKTRDGKVYESAKVTGNDAVGVKIIHAGGLARIEYARLPKDLAAKFPRDREAAQEQLTKEAKDEAAFDRSVDKELAKKKTPLEEKESTPANPDAVDATEDTTDPDDVAVETKPELKGDPTARIIALEAYIRRLEAGIEKAAKKVSDSQLKATAADMSEVVEVPRYTSGGYYTTDKYSIRRSKARAAFHQKRAAREEAKIAEAEDLIRDARAQIRSLEAQIGE